MKEEHWPNLFKRPIDVVYPFKNSKHEDREIALSIASLTHLAGIPVRNVCVFGDTPCFDAPAVATAAGLGYYHRSMSEDSRKCINIARKVAAACEDPEVTNPFLYLYDDIIFLAPCRRIVHYYDGDLRDVKTTDPSFKQVYADTIEHLQAFDLPTRNYETHRPMLVYKHQLLQSIARHNGYEHNKGINIKSIYANSYRAAVARRGKNIKISKSLLLSRVALDQFAREDGIISLPHKIDRENLEILADYLHSNNTNLSEPCSPQQETSTIPSSPAAADTAG